jgi:hypothetical protein
VKEKRVEMFYPEISPAMKWHLEQNQKLYTNFMFHGQNKEAFDQYHGESVEPVRCSGSVRS